MAKVTVRQRLGTLHDCFAHAYGTRAALMKGDPDGKKQEGEDDKKSRDERRRRSSPPTRTTLTLLSDYVWWLSAPHGREGIARARRRRVNGRPSEQDA